jgi:hypothetical protein
MFDTVFSSNTLSQMIIYMSSYVQTTEKRVKMFQYYALVLDESMGDANLFVL